MTVFFAICVVAQLACTITLGIRNERLHEENERLTLERSILEQSLKEATKGPLGEWKLWAEPVEPGFPWDRPKRANVFSIDNPVAERTSEQVRAASSLTSDFLMDGPENAYGR